MNNGRRLIQRSTRWRTAAGRVGSRQILFLTIGIALAAPGSGSGQDLATRGGPDANQSASDHVDAAANIAPMRGDDLRALMLTSRAVRNAVDRIRPSLVTIESFGGVSTVQGRIGGIRKQGEGNTTGILISPQGHIITSTFNFIQQPPVITVRTSFGKRHVAKLLGRDDVRKICMLKIEPEPGEDLPVPEWIEPADVQIGSWAISVGVGYGDATPAVSLGIISATNRIAGRAIQTDANISPANYGGPLIDLRGRVIGVCVPMNPQSQATGAGVEWYDSGIGFAIPLARAESLIAELKSGKRIRPAFLGIQATPNPEGAGLWIERVLPKSAAEQIGLLREDVILRMAGKPVDDVVAMRQILNRYIAGEEIELEWIEFTTGKERKATVRLGSPPAPEGESNPLQPPAIR